MSPDIAVTGIIGAVLALVGKIVFDWLKGHKNSTHSTNGSSGQRPVSEWKLMIRQIVYEELNSTVIPMLRDLYELQKKIWDKINSGRSK